MRHIRPVYSQLRDLHLHTRYRAGYFLLVHRDAAAGKGHIDNIARMKLVTGPDNLAFQHHTSFDACCTCCASRFLYDVRDTHRCVLRCSPAGTTIRDCSRSSLLPSEEGWKDIAWYHYDGFHRSPETLLFDSLRSSCAGLWSGKVFAPSVTQQQVYQTSVNFLWKSSMRTMPVETKHPHIKHCKAVHMDSKNIYMKKSYRWNRQLSIEQWASPKILPSRGFDQ